MPAPSVIQAGVGFRNLRIFPLTGAGLIAAPAATAYEGLFVSGVRQLVVTDPAPRLIDHVGDDSVFALDSLPPLTSLTGQLTLSKQNDTLDAVLTGQNSFVSSLASEQEMFGIGTDLRGFEVQVGALMYRQSLDVDPAGATFGSRNWQFRLCPKTLFIPLETPFDDTPEARIYEMRAQFVTAHLWGTQFTQPIEGFTRAQVLRGVSQYKPKLVAFKADGIVTVFLFPLTAQAVSTAKISVWDNGLLVSAGLTKATTGVTITAAPLINHIITVLYETA